MILLVLASCGSDKVDIPCAKVTGDQPELVAVDGNAQLAITDDSKSGAMLSLTVKLKRNKPLENLDTAKIDDIQLSSDMVVDVVGKDGASLYTLSLFGDADKVAIKKMLASGNEAEVTFAKVMTDGDKAKDALKNAAKFTLTMPEVKYPLCLNLAGTIAGKAVQMTLCIGLDHKVKGAYYYKQFGPKALMYLKGTQDDSGLIELDEYNSDGVFIGSQQFSPDNNKLTGTYRENDCYCFFGRKYSISLSSDKAMARIDLLKTDFGYFNKDYVPIEEDFMSLCEGYDFEGHDFEVVEKYSRVDYNRIDDYLKACDAVYISCDRFGKRTSKMSEQEQMPYWTPAGRTLAKIGFVSDYLAKINIKKLTAAQVKMLKQIKAKITKDYGRDISYSM